MSQHDDLIRIGHMLDAGNAIARWLDGVEWERFEKDDLLQSGVTYELQIIGEASFKLEESTRARLPEIPWTKVITMRHRLVHDYYRVDPKIVWDTATVHLPLFLMNLRSAFPDAERG